jgi:hypothetical protein
VQQLRAPTGRKSCTPSGSYCAGTATAPPRIKPDAVGADGVDNPGEPTEWRALSAPAVGAGNVPYYKEVVMSKRFAILAVSCVVAFACVAVAFGAAVKIRWFDNIAEPADADGMAILDYVQGQDDTIVQIIISDFEPDRTIDAYNAYTVEFVSPGHSAVPFVPTEDIETDGHGHGTLHLTLGAVPGFEEYGGDWSDSDIYIYVNFGSTDPANPPQLRAVGMNPSW